MSAELGPGLPVIFVGPDVDWMPSGLTIGGMYFVSEVVPNFICQAPLISLKGGPGNYPLYCACRFKPLNDGEHTLTEEEIDLPVTHPRPKVPEYV